MLFLEELDYMRLYGARRKLYVPIDPSNRKKGAAVMLLTKNSVDSYSLMNMPYIYNPKLYESLYIDRNVNAYIDSGAIIDEDPDDEAAVNEAIEEIPMHRKDIKVSVDCKTPSFNDLKLVKDVYNEKNFLKWYKFFRTPNRNICRDIKVEVYPNLATMAEYHQRDALKNNEVLKDSYSFDSTIVLVARSGYQPLEKKNGNYKQYLLNELITFVCMKTSSKCDRFLANCIGTALSGQVSDRLDDEIQGDYLSTNNYAILTSYMIKRLYKEKGEKEVARLCKTGDYSVLSLYATRRLIKNIKAFGEATLTAADRKALSDSDYGLPSKKKYPMPDESHVRSAIRFFNHVDSEDEAELARNIKKKIKKFGMSVEVGEKNRFSKYYKESALLEEFDDESKNESAYSYFSAVLNENIEFNQEEILSEAKSDKANAANRNFRKSPMWTVRMLASDIKHSSKRPKENVAQTGNYDKLHPWLLGMVEDAKTEERLQYLRADAYNGILTLKKLAKNLDDYQHGRASRYVNPKYMDKIIKKGMTVQKINSHIRWMRNIYIPAINKRAAQIRKAHHEYALLESTSFIKNWLSENNITDANSLSKWMKRNIKYSNMTKLMSPEELVNKKSGCCHDQVLFELTALRALSYKPKAWFVYEGTSDGKGGETHSYITFTDKDGKLYWFENAWSDMAGIHKVDNEYEFFLDMHSNGKWGNIKKYPEDDISVFRGKPGMTLQDLVNAQFGGNPVDESAGVSYRPDGLYKDIMQIVDKLSGEERNRIALNGNYEDSPNVINRKIKRDENGNPIGFIDAYKFDSRPYEAQLVVALDPDHRGKGYMRNMVGDYINHPIDGYRDINRFVWFVDPMNTPSVNLATHCGFKKTDTRRYRDDLGIYEDMYEYHMPFRESTDKIPLPTKMIKESVHENGYIVTDDYMMSEDFITFFNGMDNQIISEAEKKYDNRLKKYLFKERLKNNKSVIMRYQEMKAMCPWIKYTFVKLGAYRRRNVFIDLSYYHAIFMNNMRFKKDAAVNMYWDFLNRLLNESEYKTWYKKITIFMPIWPEAWDVKSADELMDYRQSINPISMIIRMLRKNPSELKKWGNKDFLFMSPSGYFRVNFSTFDLKNLAKFRRFITKLVNNDPIDDDETEDGYRPTENQDADSTAVITANIIDKLETNAGIKIDDMTGGVGNDFIPDDAEVIKPQLTFNHLRVRAEKIKLPSKYVERENKLKDKPKNSVLILAPDGDKAAEVFNQNQFDVSMFDKRGFYAP